MSAFELSCPVPATVTDRIEIGHGGGGLMTHRLIETIFKPAFAHSASDFAHDGALLAPGGATLAFSTDTYVVRPLFFPGGDIGALAINGTVNDLAMCGAEALCLSVGLVLEEGLAIADLKRIIASMAHAAQQAGARIVTGDTKVVERGKGDGIYINTSGIGRVIAPSPIGPQQVRAGDAILISGDVGRHGIAIMAVREGLGFDSEIESDCAPLLEPVRALINAGIEIHCLRDLTRGGLATSLVEIATTAQTTLRLVDGRIAVSDAVRGACEILGLDPLYVANEGRFAAIVAPADAERALAILRGFDADAALIGHARSGGGEVVIDTIGGTRPLDMMSGEQLPRIC